MATSALFSMAKYFGQVIQESFDSDSSPKISNIGNDFKTIQPGDPSVVKQQIGTHLTKLGQEMEEAEDSEIENLIAKLFDKGVTGASRYQSGQTPNEIKKLIGRYHNIVDQFKQVYNTDKPGSAERLENFMFYIKIKQLEENRADYPEKTYGTFNLTDDFKITNETLDKAGPPGSFFDSIKTENLAFSRGLIKKAIKAQVKAKKPATAAATAPTSPDEAQKKKLDAFLKIVDYVSNLESLNKELVAAESDAKTDEAKAKEKAPILKRLGEQGITEEETTAAAGETKSKLEKLIDAGIQYTDTDMVLLKKDNTFKIEIEGLVNFPRQILYYDITELVLKGTADKQIEYIPQDIDRMTSLKILNLSNNKIKSLPESMASLAYQLDLLDLTKNQLARQVPGTKDTDPDAIKPLLPIDFIEAYESRRVRKIEVYKGPPGEVPAKRPEVRVVDVRYIEINKEPAKNKFDRRFVPEQPYTSVVVVMAKKSEPEPAYDQLLDDQKLKKPSTITEAAIESNITTFNEKNNDFVAIHFKTLDLQIKGQDKPPPPDDQTPPGESAQGKLPEAEQIKQEIKKKQFDHYNQLVNLENRINGMVLEKIDETTNLLYLITRINECFKNTDQYKLKEDYINIYVEIMQLLKELAECPKDYYLDSNELFLKIPGISLFPMGEKEDIFDNLIEQLNTRYGNIIEEEKAITYLNYLNKLYDSWLKCLQKPVEPGKKAGNEAAQEQADKIISFISVLGIKTYNKIPGGDISGDKDDIVGAVGGIIEILKIIKTTIKNDDEAGTDEINKIQALITDDDLFKNQDKEQKKAELLKENSGTRQTQITTDQNKKIIEEETDLDYLLDLCIVGNKFEKGIYNDIVKLKNEHFKKEYPINFNATNEEELLKIIKLYRDLKAKNVKLTPSKVNSISGPDPNDMFKSYSYSKYSSLKYFQPLIGLIRLLSNIIEERSKFEVADAETIKTRLLKIANVNTKDADAKDKAAKAAVADARGADSATKAAAAAAATKTAEALAAATKADEAATKAAADAAPKIQSYYKDAKAAEKNEKVSNLLSNLNMKKIKFGLEFNEDYYISSAEDYDKLLGILNTLKTKVIDTETLKAKTTLYDIVNPYIELYKKGSVNATNFYEIDDYMESLEYYYGLMKQELIQKLSAGKTMLEKQAKEAGGKLDESARTAIEEQYKTAITNIDKQITNVVIGNTRELIENKKTLEYLNNYISELLLVKEGILTQLDAERNKSIIKKFDSLASASAILVKLVELLKNPETTLKDILANSAIVFNQAITQAITQQERDSDGKKDLPDDILMKTVVVKIQQIIKQQEFSKIKGFCKILPTRVSFVETVINKDPKTTKLTPIIDGLVQKIYNNLKLAEEADIGLPQIKEEIQLV